MHCPARLITPLEFVLLANGSLAAATPEAWSWTTTAARRVGWPVDRLRETGGMRLAADPLLWPPALRARPAAEAAAWVFVTAGARPWDRDDLDRRLVEEACTGGGRIAQPAVAPPVAPPPGLNPPPERLR